MSIEIKLHNRKGDITFISFISPQDENLVNTYKWHHKDSRYAMGWVGSTKMFMHHLIIGKPPKNMVVDHINGNGFDNTRQNLRFATRKQNNQNADKRRSNEYFGVYFDKKSIKWTTQCESKSLGSYDNVLDAAIAYDTYSFLVFGEHAKNNNLITYDECKHIDINGLIKTNKSNLPRNIFLSKSGKKYFVKICETKSELFITIEEAQLFLTNYINNKKIEEEKIHASKIITRDINSFAIIKCINGEVKVDDILWHTLSKYSWSIDKHGYPTGRINTNTVRMHRLIMELNGHDLNKINEDNCIIDHINNNKIDNRLENLRINTISGNNHNRTKSKNATSKYKGVSYFKRDKNWMVQIRKDEKYYFGGYFETENEAAIAYNIKANELYGEFANLNIINNI